MLIELQQCGFILFALLTAVLCSDMSSTIETSNVKVVMMEDDDQKIIGATESKRGYNYMISLQVYIDEKTFFGIHTGRKVWAHNCGGSIVNDKCIVTAAHCVDRVPKGLMSIVAGTNNLSDSSGKRYYLDDYIIHEDYIELNRSDIAVLRLNDTMKWSDKIAPLIITDKFTGGGVDLKLTGWGYTNPPRFGTTPDRLREAVLTSMTTKRCNDKGMPAGESEICTYERPLKGACGGDSGGPLVYQDDDNAELVGIVSYGTIVCAIGRPDVFTRASVFYDWINEKCS